jgi:EAL domain-containing protein (putative c-di-GMP-specific phosphodiesterase class I)
VPALWRAIADGSGTEVDLELEITESVIMDGIENNAAVLNAIRDMGVRVSIDDFGTGFSSLSYLARLPVDTIKIDRSFVVEMNANTQGLQIVSAIIQLAHRLGLQVVAEGVETEDQSRMLRLLRCHQMQGYWVSKPLPAAEFEDRFLRMRSSRCGPSTGGVVRGIPT